jgi:hypothetical protein
MVNRRSWESVSDEMSNKERSNDGPVRLPQ